MISDEEDYYQKSIPKLNFEVKSWKSSKIETKSNGKWLTFINSETNEQLNSSKKLLINNNKNEKLYYKYKINKINPLPIYEKQIQPQKIDNYNSFRPKKSLIINKTIESFKIKEKLPHLPEISFTPRRNYFQGRNIKQSPFRISLKILNKEKEIKENEKIIEFYKFNFKQKN